VSDKKKIQVLLNPEDYDAFELLAKAAHRPMGNLARVLILSYITDHTEATDADK